MKCTKLFLCSSALILTLCSFSANAADSPAPKPARKQKKNAPAAQPAPERSVIGKVERLDPQLDSLLPADSQIEVLASGFDWSEGPVWVPTGKYLLFSDVPRNTVYKWVEGSQAEEFLNPSGYTQGAARAGEPGSNGLTLDRQGRLVLCQHGDRQVARLEKNGTFTPLARYFKFRRFNSPNDLVYKSNGDLYFTDPPYGLQKLNADPAKELAFNGVFRVTPAGEVVLLSTELTFPNGIAFSPDEKTLYVAVSDPKNPVIMAFDVLPNGNIDHGRVFFNAASLAQENRKGLPDGLKVDQSGNLFATGPGGVLVISPRGKLLGILNTGEATANCAWGDDGSVLYITADMHLCRIRTTTKGPGFK